MGREDPLEKAIATNSDILDWRISWTEEPSRPQSVGSQRVGHDQATKKKFFFLLPSLGFEQFQLRDYVCSFCTASDWNIARYRKSLHLGLLKE